MVSYLSASIVISRRLPFLTSISLSRPRNDIAHDTVCTIHHNWDLSHRLLSTADELNWERLSLNQAASKWHQSCPRRVFKCGCHEHHTHNLAAAASGRLLLRCAAYFWANLPKLRCSGFYHQLNSTLFYRWPMEEGALHCWAVLHWGQTYKQFQGFRRWRRNLGNILLGLGCWEKDTDLENGKHTLVVALVDIFCCR